MSFAEKIKLEVKRKAAFQCCRCRNIGIEVHHIIPESEGGTDDIENAAPLCAKCHTDFGDNPQKRREIKQMRDWWYGQVNAMFKAAPDFPPIFEKIDAAVLNIQQHTEEKVDELKSALRELADKQHESSIKEIDRITPALAQNTSSSIVTSSTVAFILEKMEQGNINNFRIYKNKDGILTIVYDEI